MRHELKRRLGSAIVELDLRRQAAREVRGQAVLEGVVAPDFTRQSKEMLRRMALDHKALEERLKQCPEFPGWKESWAECALLVDPKLSLEHLCRRLSTPALSAKELVGHGNPHWLFATLGPVVDRQSVDDSREELMKTVGRSMLSLWEGLQLAIVCAEVVRAPGGIIVEVPSRPSWVAQISYGTAWVLEYRLIRRDFLRQDVHIPTKMRAVTSTENVAIDTESSLVMAH